MFNLWAVRAVFGVTFVALLLLQITVSRTCQYHWLPFIEWLVRIKRSFHNFQVFSIALPWFATQTQGDHAYSYTGKNSWLSFLTSVGFVWHCYLVLVADLIYGCHTSYETTRTTVTGPALAQHAMGLEPNPKVRYFSCLRICRELVCTEFSRSLYNRRYGDYIVHASRNCSKSRRFQWIVLLNIVAVLWS